MFKGAKIAVEKQTVTIRNAQANIMLSTVDSITLYCVTLGRNIVTWFTLAIYGR